MKIEKILYEKEALTIEVKVNLNSFAFWVLQYRECVEVLSGKGG